MANVGGFVDDAQHGPLKVLYLVPRGNLDLILSVVFFENHLSALFAANQIIFERPLWSSCSEIFIFLFIEAPHINYYQ